MLDIKFVSLIAHPDYPGERIAALGILANVLDSKFLKHPFLRKYTALVNEDLTATYSRDIQKWLLVAPVIGIVTGLIITGIAVLVLDVIWATLLPYYLAHHWAIVVGLVIGFFVTGVIMQFCTPDPDEHSTEEIIRSYHEHQGDIEMRPFWWKLLAAVTTVGSGGSAALEGPSIYSGGAIGSWLWTQAAALRARAARSPHHADQRRGGRDGGGVSRAADRARVRARDAVQGRPRARGAAAVADRVGGLVRDAGVVRRRRSRCSVSRAARSFRAARPLVVGAARRASSG